MKHLKQRLNHPTHRLRRILPAAGFLTCLVTAALVQAQSEPAPTLDPLEVKAQASELYHVERTATFTKTDTPLIDTPQAVTILTDDFLKDVTVTSIGDAVRYVPGVGTAQGEGNRDTIVLRGTSSTGDYFIDGLRDDTQYYRDFYNIERIEVLKGPAGMIFGRGGPGGVLNRVSKQAVLGGDSFYEISALAGMWDQYRGVLDFNQALTETAAVRVPALYENSHSFRDGVFIKRHGVNPTFGWEVGERTTLRVGVEYFTDDRIADRGIPSFNGKPFETDNSTFFGDPDRSPTNVYVRALSASIDHEIGDGATFRNATRYAAYDKFYQNVYAGGPVTAGMVAIDAYNNATERESFFNQSDLVFDFNTGPIGHTFLAGLELGRQDTDNFRETGYSSATADTRLGSVPASNPRYNGPVYWRQSASDADNNSVATTVAVYVQDQIQLLPKLQLIGGVRLDNFQVDFRNDRTGLELESSDNFASPRAGLVFKPIDNLALYGSYALSYVPRAGEQLASLSVTNAALEPEQFQNFEVGVKWDATERLAFTAAAYQLDRANQAITDPTAGLPGGPPAGTLILVDGQQVQGVELGASGQISERWSITGGYAYQDGETQTTSGPILAGTRIQQLPRHSLSLWNRYDLNERWGVGFGAIYRDDIFAAADNAVTLPSFVRFDAALFYRFNENLQAQLNIENIFDTDYYATAHNNNNITPGSPTAVRLGVTVRF